jgi:DNA-binding IclR family transcriptional regulator
MLKERMSRPALSASRAIEMLNLLAAHPTEDFTLSDIAELLAINAASTHAVLTVLTEAGYLVRHPRRKTYALGPGLVAAGTAALEHHPAIDAARDESRRLSRELGMEVAVTAAAGSDIVFLARSGRPQARGLPVHPGQRVPLTPPLGTTFLAWADEVDVITWLQRAPVSTIPAELEHYRAALDVVRRRGYSIGLEASARKGLGDSLDHLADEPRAEGVRTAIAESIAELGHAPYQLEHVDTEGCYDVSTIAAPVFDASGTVPLSITLVGLPPATSGRDVLAYGERVRDCGLIVTKQTHGSVPNGRELRPGRAPVV